MTSYAIPQHVCCCDAGDGIVFLNLRTERYLALPRRDGELLAALVSGWPGHPYSGQLDAKQLIEAEETATELLNNGLLEAAASSQPPRIQGSYRPPLDAVELSGRIPQTEPALKLIHFVRFFRSCLRVALRRRFLSFDAIVQGIGERNREIAQRARAPSNEELRTKVNVFRRIRTLVYTARDRCFVDCLVTIEFLQRSGIPANFVIGVELRPFTAHSWVQHQALVLTDWKENVEQLTPILVA